MSNSGFIRGMTASLQRYAEPELGAEATPWAASAGLVYSSDYCWQCVSHVQEDHLENLYAVSFLPHPTDKVFAAVGSRYASVYNCSTATGDMEVLQVYEDEDPDESFFAVALAELSTGQLVAAVAGHGGHAKVIDLSTCTITHVLKGHGGEVHCMERHATNSDFLFTGSVDHSVRLWCMTTGICAALFGGPAAHRASVMCLAVHPAGTLLAVGAEESAICLWGLDDEAVITGMRRAATWDPEQAVYSQTSLPEPASIRDPIWRRWDVHEQPVDAIAWAGNCILSKPSASPVGLMWIPDAGVDGAAHPVASRGPRHGMTEIRGLKLGRCHEEEERLRIRTSPSQALAAYGGHGLGLLICYLWEQPHRAVCPYATVELPNTPSERGSSRKSSKSKRSRRGNGATTRDFVFSTDNKTIIAVGTNGQIWRVEARPSAAAKLFVPALGLLS